MKKNHFQKQLDILLGEATRSEIIIVCSCAIIFPLILPLYSIYSGLNWSALQILIAFGIAFDIMSGCLVYNSFSHKKISYKEKQLSVYVKHTLLHMQPLVIASFFSENLLLYIGLYWFIMYIVFVSLFEPVLIVSKKAENIITSIFIAINLVFLVLCITLIKNQSNLLYGVLNYIILVPLTIIQYLLPLRSQRLYGTAIVVFVCILNMMFLKAPDGFQWFMPVLCIKLFMGYNARENIILGV